MNQQQKVYLSKRIEQIAQIKKSEIEKKISEVDVKIFLKRLKFKSIVFPQRHYSIKLSQILFKEERMPEDSRYSDFFKINESEMFSNFESVQEAYNKAELARANKVLVKASEIEKYVVKLQDEVMLGDAEEALKQLSEFEKKVF